MSYQPYPKTLYHVTGAVVRVESRADHLALGEGYFESPGEAERASVEKAAPKAKKGEK